MKLKILLRKSGYSDKGIKFFKEELNVGKIEDPTVHYIYRTVWGYDGDLSKN